MASTDMVKVARYLASQPFPTTENVYMDLTTQLPIVPTPHLCPAGWHATRVSGCNRMVQPSAHVGFKLGKSRDIDF